MYDCNANRITVAFIVHLHLAFYIAILSGDSRTEIQGEPKFYLTTKKQQSSVSVILTNSVVCS